MADEVSEQPCSIALEGGTVSGLLLRPRGARTVLVLGHGAGAGMRHPFLERLSRRLAAHDVATLRYQFPFAETGRKRPDSPARAVATVRAACAQARAELPELKLLAGGKSFGGRMTSTAQAEQPLPGVRGLVFVGFPLHPANRPETRRADHLAGVGVPMLFLQGTRDVLADAGLIRAVTERLAPRATLHVVAGADHAFAVLKRSGRTGEEVVEELAEAIAAWADLVP